MAEYRKAPEAVAALSAEQFRVTQQSDTVEGDGYGAYLDEVEDIQ